MVPAVGAVLVVGGILVGLWSRPTDGQTPPPRRSDAVQDAETPRAIPETRPEQRRTEHDRSHEFGVEVTGTFARTRKA